MVNIKDFYRIQALFIYLLYQLFYLAPVYVTEYLLEEDAVDLVEEMDSEECKNIFANSQIYAVLF